METTKISSLEQFEDIVNADDSIDLSEQGVAELYRVWKYRVDNGADDYLVGIPNWLAEDKFGKRRPFFFGAVEFDDPNKAAVLFKNCRLIDKNILEAGVWDEVSMSEIVENVDNSEDPDSYVSEPGLVWAPRSQMKVFELQT